MLTTEEIQELYPNINKDIVREGINQAEDRLKDCLSTKTQLEQKALIILGAYVAIQLAIFSAIAFLYKSNAINPLFFTLLLSGLVFTVGSIYLVLSLRASDYGTMGRSPSTWLQPDTLEGDSHTHALILAHVLHGYDHRIETSIQSNAVKSRQLIIAIVAGVSSPIVFIVTLLLSKFLFSL